MEEECQWETLLNGCNYSDVHITLSYILSTMIKHLDPDNNGIHRNHHLCNALSCFCADPCKSNAIELLNIYPGFKRIFALANSRYVGYVED